MSLSSARGSFVGMSELQLSSTIETKREKWGNARFLKKVLYVGAP